MLRILGDTLRFLSRKERLQLALLTLARSGSSVLDLAGVAGIGFMATATTQFLVHGSGSPIDIQFLGRTVPSFELSALVPLALATFALFILKAAIATFCTKKLALVIALGEARATKVIVGSLLGRELTCREKQSSEELYFLASRGVSAAFTENLNYLSTLCAEGALFLGMLSTFAIVDFGSTLWVVCYFAVIALTVNLLVGKRLSRTMVDLNQGLTRAHSLVSDMHGAFKELVLSGQMDYYLEELHAVRIRVARKISNQYFLNTLPRYALEVLVIIGLMLFVGQKLVSTDLASSAATVGIFLTGSFRLVTAMLPWQTALIGLRQGSAVGRDAILALKTGAAQGGSPHGEEMGSGPIGVTFERVSFAYPGATGLSVADVSFHLEPGESAAFIGKSGSGKSTIVDIMTGMRSPESGRVLLDDLPAKNYISSFPGKVSYLPQAPRLVSGTLEQNITLGRDLGGSAKSNLAYAIEFSGLGELISDLPLGLRTELSPSTQELSGGQLQRVGLARALFTQPALLVLDEATSALDAQAESQITGLITQLHGSVTVVQVAHRLSSIRNVNKVFLVENASIIDQGSLQDLATRNPQVQQALDLFAAGDKSGGELV